MRLHRFRPLLSVLLLLPLGACWMPGFLSFPPQARGNRVDDEQLKQMVPGTSTRADATAALGSPTAKATFDDNTWLYIGELTKPVIGGTLDVLDQQVVMLKFDSKGVLQDIERKQTADARPVQMIDRSTPSPGSDASWLQQLLGNVGKFNAAAPAGPSNNRSGTSSGTGASGY